ncbi:histone-lysine N-methyltransferase [Coccidioides immitis RS]|uniref:Histone-lysine N-methyltransferase n=2 Tax=Coccidioides immitis TaxID=5501 RepID=J3KH04_COCIM|nr:histone-lysine N-methyltransferase [Coccidioides immitis RS]EAS35087.3 histone-lysine N-methyltransferase [Coccidioides immitis RS]TPX26627.1 hypothetical protein DIZ76_012089 [Coccidioides immitis]
MARDPMLSPSSTPTSSALDSDATAIDATVPVLTPATSISEQSTPVDTEKDGEHRAKKAKASRRVTRSSLKNGELEANGGGEAMVTRPNDESLDNTNTQEDEDCTSLLNGAEDASGSVDKWSSKNAEAAGKKPNKKAGNKSPKRRSTRLSLLAKTMDLAQSAPSVLGKRTLDAISKSKDKVKTIDRKASLRPRVENEKKEASTPAPQEPSPKKRRVSGDNKSTCQVPRQEQTATRENSLIRQKRKPWLKHGLYAGQEYIDSSVPKSKRGTRDAKNNGQQSQVFPFPMYAGARLLENGRAYKLPFDIFSPLPHGQPKPNEWRKANKNVFVGDAASIWKAAKIKEHSTCTCTPETGCDENCQNRYMFYECDDTNCKLGSELCRNRPFSALRRRAKAGGKFNIGVEVIKTEDRGYGVRSNRSFDPNQIIVEYTGEILTQEECERRMRTVYKKNECYYLMYFDQNMVIDATRGSIARFINHSCEPNCRMEKWTVAGKPRMALFAGEDGIMTGEELTYDYNFDPYSQKNVQECRCGAPTCRGVLGPRPKESWKNKDKEKKSAPAAKRKVDSALDESASRLNKKPKPSRASSLKTGIKKAVSKARTALKSTQTKGKVKRVGRPAKKAVSIKPIPVKKRRSTLTRAKMPVKSASKSAEGDEKPPRNKGRKLKMPSKPRLGNSIAAARASNKTPALMRKFLEAGDTKGGAKVVSDTIKPGRKTRAARTADVRSSPDNVPVSRKRGRAKKTS